MTQPVQLALIADGPSDEALLRPLTWAFRQRVPGAPLLAPIFHVRRPPSRDLNHLVQEVMASQAPDILFVHRDAEGVALETRKREIPVLPRVVAVVPVRMTEAWLLISERAIRQAAGNPNGQVALEVPPPRRLEGLADPKSTLRELLVRASEFKGRRRQQFQSVAAARRVAEYIEDFSVLRALSAFQELERDLASVWPQQ